MAEAEMAADKADKSDKNKHVSIYTVAAAAAVSYATVSRVFNNHPEVNAETRQRVLDVAKQLGYVPNPLARGLSKKQTSAVGVIVPGIADPFFMPITQSIEEHARRLGYITLLRDTGRSVDAALEGVDVLAQFHVSGVIILGGSDERDSELATRLKGIPAVVVLRQAQAALFPAVYLDHSQGAQMVVAYLAGQGRRRIAFVGGDLNSVAARERLQGYHIGLAQAELAAEPAWIEPGYFTLSGGAAATQRLLTLPAAQRPDAIFYASDTMALAGLHELRQAGLRVPEEIAVVGYGNIEFAAISAPPLTTVEVSRERMGALAVELLQQLRNQAQRPEDIQVEVSLVVRQSSS